MERIKEKLNSLKKETQGVLKEEKDPENRITLKKQLIEIKKIDEQLTLFQETNMDPRKKAFFKKCLEKAVDGYIFNAKELNYSVVKIRELQSEIYQLLKVKSTK